MNCDKFIYMKDRKSIQIMNRPFTDDNHSVTNQVDHVEYRMNYATSIYYESGNLNKFYITSIILRISGKNCYDSLLREINC